jgi:hypothetical protein
MKFRLLTFSTVLLASTQALAQLPSEFATLACKPSQSDSPELIVEKSGREWLLSIQTSEAKKLVLRSAMPISNAQRASEVGYFVYFLANSSTRKIAGGSCTVLRTGNPCRSPRLLCPPLSACVTPDGRKLAYVTQRLGAVQIESAPAYERFRYWDDPAPKDHVLVHAPNGG